MIKRDARKLNQETQEEIRVRAIKLILSGKTHQEVSELLEVSRQIVTIWFGIYKEGGMKALRKKTRGRREGNKRISQLEQEVQAKRWIIEKTPDQLKLKFALWTRQAVLELIEEKFGIKLSIRCIGHYLNRWGFTPQKPIKRAYEQQPKEVQKWLKETYPMIEKRAVNESCEIHWGDETGVNSHANICKGYSPKGQKPVLFTPGKKFSASMISTVTNKGILRFLIYDKALDVAIFLRFLNQLLHGSSKKIFLIVDNLRVHHAIKVRSWLEKHNDEIEIFYLPSYSPEKNPDEYVNQDIKGHIRKQKMPTNQNEMKMTLKNYMKKLQNNKSKVASFFNHKEVLYAKTA